MTGETGFYTRRRFLSGSGVLAAATMTSAPLAAIASEELPELEVPTGTPSSLAEDEDHWRKIAAYYPRKEGITNLENGYFGVMPTPILAEYQAHTERVNRANSHYARAEFYRDYRAYRKRTAEELGVGTKEITFTRGATEALQNLLTGYNLLRPGDGVMYADLDYGDMQEVMDWLVERRGVSVVRFDIPEPATKEAVLSTYDRMLRENPQVRLLLLTHVSNRTGLVMPVAEIAAMARAQGVDVVLDAAHSFGQVDFKVDDLGVDFIGLNFHKWMGSPVGVGLIYIREGRLADIDPCLGNRSFPEDNILSRVSSGTSNFAAFNMVPAVLDFHQSLGPKHKQARLRYLRDRWVNAVRDIKNLEILTPDEDDMACAITAFRVKGRTSREENRAIVNELLEHHQISTVWRNGVAKGDCVRVTPNIYSLSEDVDRLATALRDIVPA